MIKIERVSEQLPAMPLYVHPIKLIRHQDERITYIGKGLSQADLVCLRSKTPAKPNSASCSVYYFEVDVVDAGARAQIYVGLSDKNFELGKQPGTLPRSFALRLDGKVYKESGNGETFCQRFVTGDTVGCGLDYEAAEIFYTRNGAILGNAVVGVPIREYFAILGMNSPNEAVQINFGHKPFLYDFEGRVKRANEARQKEIESLDVSLPSLIDVIHYHLMRKGFTETLTEFDSVAGIATEHKLLKVKGRRKLSDMITPSVANECAQCGGACKGAICDTCIVAMMREAEVNDSPTINAKRGSRRAGSIDWGTIFLKPEETESETVSQPETNVSVAKLKTRGTVRTSITRGEIEAGIKILQTSFPAFFSRRDSLALPALFVLRFVELVLGRQHVEALEYARSSLSYFRYHRIPLADGSKFQVRFAMGLLCYEDPLKSPLQFLTTFAQRELTADLVNTALLELEEDSPDYRLETLLKQLIATQSVLREVYTKSKDDHVSLEV